MMTRFLTTTALALALATPALATSPLRGDVQNMLNQSTYDIEVESLTDEQVRALYAALSSTDGAAERQAIIDSIVNDSQFVMDDAMFSDEELGGSNSIRDAVERLLDGENVDADVDDLTDAQVAALYMELTSGDGTDTAQIEAIIDG